MARNGKTKLVLQTKLLKQFVIGFFLRPSSTIELLVDTHGQQRTVRL
nr:MAG TPA: hypothetical protein [Caudoviricetes sp.]